MKKTKVPPTTPSKRVKVGPINRTLRKGNQRLKKFLKK